MELMKKKQIIITSLIAIITFIVGFFVGDSSAINRVNKQIGSNVASQQSKPVATNDKPKEAAKEVKLTEPAAVGKVELKVLEAKESDAISNKAGNSTPSGKFIIIKLELKNNGDQATEYNTRDFKLKKDKTIYEVDDNAFDALGHLNSQEKIYNENKNFIGVYDKFNAGISKNTYIVFDVSKETKLEDLKLTVNQNNTVYFNLK